MADETMTETAATTEAPTVAPAEKKTRKPRATKAVAETSSEIAHLSAEQPVKKARAKRGSKTAPVKAETAAAEVKKVAARTPRAMAVDDIADLIKLEEENKQLRKELSDKLRSENADLRKRLGKA